MTYPYPQLRGKTFVVTGGAGFIGYALSRRLLDSGASVECVDDLRSSLRTPDELRALQSGTQGRFQWRNTSVDAWFYDAVERGDTSRPDGIFHLASPVGPAGVLQHAGNIALDILSDTALMSELAMTWGVRMVHVSTSEVYGGGQQGLCREDMPCVIQPGATARLEYAVGKLAAETMLLNRSTAQDLDVLIIRPFNVAGRGQNPEGGFVVPRFIRQAISGEPLTVFGDGSAIRAFTHVDDIVDGLILAYLRGAPGAVYNLGNPANRITIQQLAEAVIKVCESQSGISYTSGKTIFGPSYAEANDKFPDADRAIRELDWMPAYFVEQVIADALVWIRRYDSINLLSA